MIPIIGIPILNRGDLLLRLFESIDYPISTAHILVNRINDTIDPSVAIAIDSLMATQHPYVQDIVVTDDATLYKEDGSIFSTNLGVAGSWNFILKTWFPSAEYTMLVGNDIQFTPGDLEKFDKYMKSIPDRNKKGIACGNQGYSCFAILPHTLNIVGYFDENIYPAYLEDCDYSWRCKLAGLDNSDVPDTQLVHGEAPSWGSSTIYSNKDFRNKNGYTHGLNFVYYNKKWGGNNGEEKFTRPYNDETNSIKFWEPCTNRVAW